MNETIEPEDLPANLVRKCARCNDFTAEMRSVTDTYERRVDARTHMPLGPSAQVGRDYRFRCTKCGAEFMVPGGLTVMRLGALAVLGLVVIIGGLSQGMWFAAPIGLLLGVPVAWALYQRKRHPGMF